MLFPLSTFITFELFDKALGWQVSLSLSVLLIVHELGHYFAAQLLGVPCSLPILTPFGAVVFMRDHLESSRSMIAIALCGPLFGGATALFLVFVGAVTHDRTIETEGIFGLGFNVLQLLPTLPFDGGWVSYGLGAKYIIVGSLAVAVLVLTRHLAIWIFFFQLFGMLQGWLVHSLDVEPHLKFSLTSVLICILLLVILLGSSLLLDPHSLNWFFSW
jgi:hypothetical protein